MLRLDFPSNLHQGRVEPEGLATDLAEPLCPAWQDDNLLHHQFDQVPLEVDICFLPDLTE
jgi:hypothetical protein